MTITKVKVVYDDGSTALFDTLDQAVAAGQDPQPKAEVTVEATPEETTADEKTEEGDAG